MDSSPGSPMGGDDEQSLLESDKKRQPGVKRACNECRQQKVSESTWVASTQSPTCATQPSTRNPWQDIHTLLMRSPVHFASACLD